jgi:hypothetical protein
MGILHLSFYIFSENTIKGLRPPASPNHQQNGSQIGGDTNIDQSLDRVPTAMAGRPKFLEIKVLELIRKDFIVKKCKLLFGLCEGCLVSFCF